MFICYAKLGESTIPIVCESIEQSLLLDSHIVLKGTKMVEDNVLPILDINEMCISKSQIEYYVSGNLKKENEKLFDALELSRKKNQEKVEENRKVEEFIEKKKEVKRKKK